MLDNLNKLSKFVAEMQPVDKEDPVATHATSDSKWWYHAAPAHNSFIKEVLHPESTSDYSGAVYIRSASNYWMEACLPYHFHSMEMEEIATALWSNPTKANITADNDLFDADPARVIIDAISLAVEAKRTVNSAEANTHVGQAVDHLRAALRCVA